MSGWIASRPAGLWWLSLAAVFLLAALARPQTLREVALRDLIFVVDITGSMNTRDYAVGGAPASRLDIAKSEIIRQLRSLPCGSRAGLAIFTERRSFALFAPAEVCENFAPMSGTIAALDWRMGWDGDSRVSSGVQSAIRLANTMRADLVFLTDGHEAPPLPFAGRRKMAGGAESGGILIGVGGDALSPIPKYDEDGREIGFYSVSDMVHGSRVGMAPPTASSAQGFHPRNNPYGEDDLRGSEHLSSVRTTYLRELAAEAGLAYAPLDRGPAIDEAVARATRARLVETRVFLDPLLAALALATLLAAHLSISSAPPWPLRAKAAPASVPPRTIVSPPPRARMAAKSARRHKAAWRPAEARRPDMARQDMTEPDITEPDITEKDRA